MAAGARSVLVVAAAAALALSAVGCTRDSGGATGDTGTSQFGAAPPGGDAASPSTGTGSVASPSPSVPPAPPATASPAPAGGAELHASYQVARGPLGANATVAVTITNQGTADSAGWTVSVGLSGVGLVVTPGPNVKYEVRNGQQVFTPDGTGAAISPGGRLIFTFGVTGVNVGVSACTIDQRACTAS